MAASPASPSDGLHLDGPDADGSLPPTDPVGSLTEWLRRRSDRQLATLLRRRPDLALPTPPDVAALAARVGVRTSTQRAVDGLDAFTLRVLESLVLTADADGSDDAIRTAGGGGECDADTAAAIDDLLDLGLIWGEPANLHLTPTVRAAIGTYPAALGRPAATLFALLPDTQLVPVLRRLGLPPAGQPTAGRSVAAVLTDPGRLADLIDESEPAEREVLDRLATGPPVGTVRNTRLALSFGSAPDDELTPPHRLIQRGLLAPIDTQRVELPREVGLALRRGGTTRAAPPEIRLVERAPADLDRLGTTAVLESVRLVDALADSWTAHPPSLLRSGGLGVRDLKRTARDLGVDEPTAALVAETAYAAGLVNSTIGAEPAYLPTTDYDVWREGSPAQRWLSLAMAWVTMTRQPSLVGRRGDRDRVITALGPDAERGTVPLLRHQVLDVLAALAPGTAPADRGDVLGLLAWHQPRRAPGQRALVEAVLAEADQLGVTAAGGLTGYSRTMLAAPSSGAGSALGTTAARSLPASAAEDALASALPEPVDHFLVQPDLTVVVPGPPEPALGVELGLVADLESTGGASVYRITERSVRRALDAGRTGDQLSTFVSEHSRTPVPQALRYLIDDAARRHGVLRAGAARAYLRCDDTALLTRVLSERGVEVLNLRLIAASVVIADAPVTKVLEVLREAGFAPAAEAPGGDLITIGIDAPRAPARPPGRAMITRGAVDSDATLAELVRRIRSGDALAGMDRRVQTIAQHTPGVTSATTMERLRRAVREARMVWFGSAEADGTTTAHTLQPISLAAGTVRGYERGRNGLMSYPVHRITSIRVLDDDEDEALGDDRALGADPAGADADADAELT